MSNVVLFENAKLPSYLAKRKSSVSDLISHVGGGGYPVLSIKGKNFAVVKGDERTLIQKEDSDGDLVPARSIEVVIIKANPNLSKNFYKAEYEEGVNAEPDCSSANGISPDPHIEKPISKACATCPKNVWGSGKGGKGKACQDHRRVAVAPAGQLNDPMLLRIPPASLKPLAEYAKMLDKRGVDYDAVITTLKFDAEAPTPLLVFSPRKADPFLTEEQYLEVQEQKQSDLVEQIIGLGEQPVRESKTASDDEEFETSAPKKKVVDDEDDAPAPKKKAKVVDEEEAPAPKKKAADAEEEVPAPKKKAKVTDDLEKDLDSLLEELGD